MANPYSIAYVGQDEAMWDGLDVFSISEVGNCLRDYALRDCRSCGSCCFCYVAHVWHQSTVVNAAAAPDGTTQHFVMQDCIEHRLKSVQDVAGYIKQMPLPDEYHGWRLDEVRSRSLYPSAGDRSAMCCSMYF